MQLRPYRPEDRDGVIALIDGVYLEYDDQVCLENADADLLDIPGHYLAAGGSFVVLDDAGRIRGSHAIVPLDAPRRVCTFRRLYLDAELRGGDWGRRLMEWAIETAAAQNFRRVEFWSDTRFTRAHRFFASLEFQRDGRVREMLDSYQPYHEYFFFRELTTGESAARREVLSNADLSPASHR